MPSHYANQKLNSYYSSHFSGPLAFPTPSLMLPSTRTVQEINIDTRTHILIFTCTWPRPETVVLSTGLDIKSLILFLISTLKLEESPKRITQAP